MQKWYTVDFLTHKSARNQGQRPQYFVEDDHEPIVPKPVFYEVQGEIRRREGLAHDLGSIRFGERMAIRGRLVCGRCGGALRRYSRGYLDVATWVCERRVATAGSSDGLEGGAGVAPGRCGYRVVPEGEVQLAVVRAFNQLPRKRDKLVSMRDELQRGELGRFDALLQSLEDEQAQL